MAFQGDSIFWVEVGKVVPNPFQPRKEFNEAKLKELSESIRMYGVLQPLTVTRNEIQGEGGAFYTEYELIAGERRLRASKLAGLEQVPVIIRSGEDTEQEKLELAIIENLQREDLNAVDRALAFRQLADVFELSHVQVAKKVGRSREYVSNTIRLLGLPDCILNSVSLGDISEGHARTLLMLRDRPEEQDVVYREILMKKLSVREVERIVRKIASDKVRKKKWVNSDSELIAIEKEFTDTLGTRVQISKTDFGGKLTIDYFSDEDLQKLLSLMKQEDEKREKASGSDSDEESTTVVHEMSPEASLIAKLAYAIPLVAVDELVTKEETPVQKPEEKEPVHSEAPVESTPEQKTESTSAPSSIESSKDTTDPTIVPSHAFHAESIPTEEDQQVSVSMPQDQQVPIQTEVQKVSPEPEIQNPASEVSSSETEQQNPLQGVVATEQQNTVTEEDPVLDPAQASDKEFEFISQHTESAIREDLVNPYQEKEPVAKEQVKTPVPELPDENGEDLYSMKNFSL